MHDHVLGDPKAPLVLVEYADFECPYCGMAYPYVKRAARHFGNDLAIVFRTFPLTQIHPHAMHAAQAAEAAGLQQHFWEMHDILFENQSHLEDESLLQYARTVGLDIDRFKSDFASRSVIDAIVASVRQGNEDGVEGTPALFLNGEELELGNFQDIEAVIRAQAKRLEAGRPQQ